MTELPRSRSTNECCFTDRTAKALWAAVEEYEREVPIIVFLGGRGPGKGEREPRENRSRRGDIRNLLHGRWISPEGHPAGRIEVWYPEDLFVDVQGAGGPGRNLLDLENDLAETVHVVVLVLEEDAFGAACELGAFCNVPDLMKKLIVVVPDLFRGDDGFVRRGPLSKLESLDTGGGEHRVLYADLRGNLADLAPKLKNSIGQVLAPLPSVGRVMNPVVAGTLLQFGVYVGDPVRAGDLRNLLRTAAGASSPGAQLDRLYLVAIARLLASGVVREVDRTQPIVGPGEAIYGLTGAGWSEVHDRLARTRKLRDLFDDLRISVLKARLT